ncbi:MAG TPA: iron ABC transporter permease, partial [Jatrophihabitantaceae bacterium]|nr:iron ABC transporter permease [Jatrophihabitantaceae bacterium]
MSTTAVQQPKRLGARRRRPGGALLPVSAAVALLLLLPLGLIALDAVDAGWSEVRQVLFRSRSADLLLGTVELAVVVTLAAAVLGVAAAWCTERTSLPARRAWTVLLVLPVAMPDFVVGYAWHSIDPNLIGLRGAALVMTLSTYPLVYLPVAAALRRSDPALEEAARSLGTGGWATFYRV